ncbi:MAG: sulfite exporter TauE/SafE family protein [Chloroflexi bacterium]|nr:sulfite exporter TauE/SafE family protein [Chloroflexota bacterium]
MGQGGKSLAEGGAAGPIYHGDPLLPQEKPTFGAVEPVTLIPAAFIILAGSTVKSTTGFGFALTASPFLLLMWEPLLVVPILVPLVFIVDLLIVVQGIRRVEMRQVVPMAAAAALGIPLGNYVLLAVSERILTLAIAIGVLAFALLLLIGYTLPIRRERMAGGVAGFLSGILMTSTAVSGPPVALFMINPRWERDTFRASLGMFFLVNEVMAMVSLGASGVLTRGTLQVSLVLVPMVLVGYRLAMLVLPRIRQELFLRIATAIVMAAAVLAIGSEVVRL